MRILVDENIPLMTVSELKRLGHDVQDIRGSTQEGLSDIALWELAKEEKHLLITTDKGFDQKFNRKNLLHYLFPGKDFDSSAC